MFRGLPAADAESSATTLVKSDVVDEYNKAVETWFTNTSPPLSELKRILQVLCFVFTRDR